MKLAPVLPLHKHPPPHRGWREWLSRLRTPTTRAGGQGSAPEQRHSVGQAEPLMAASVERCPDRTISAFTSTTHANTGSARASMLAFLTEAGLVRRDDTVARLPPPLPLRHVDPIEPVSFPQPQGSIGAPVTRLVPVRAPLKIAERKAFPSLRAIAVAHEDCNAIGTVEVTCSSQTLQLKFVSISAYADGFVPYPATTGEQVELRYEQIVQAVVDDAGLVHLVLDPGATRFNRLVLAGFARSATLDHRANARRRERMERRIASVCLVAWIPIALLIQQLVSKGSTGMALAAGASVSAFLYAIRREVAARWVWFGGTSEAARDSFLAELAFRLPGLLTAPSVAVPAVPTVASANDNSGWDQRRLWLVGGSVAAAAAISILVGRALLEPGPTSQTGRTVPVEWTEVAGQAPIPPSISPDVVPEPTVVLPPCSCERADSPLWKDGIPRLTVLSRDRGGVTSPEKPSVYPEVAVVNNGDTDLVDVALVVDFLLAARDGHPARRTDQKALFWEGALVPGRAIKWRVRGRGDDFTVTSQVSGLIGEGGVGPAPADTFFDLAMTARTPSVRLHGTKMLAFLGDRRTQEAIDKLHREGRSEMEDALRNISATLDPLRVCSVSQQPGSDGKIHVEACVFNAGNKTLQGSSLVARSLRDGIPRETRWQVQTELLPLTGVHTNAEVDVVPGNADDLLLDVRAEPL